MVNAALGAAGTGCPPGDGNHDGEITIDEILQAVNNALNGQRDAVVQVKQRGGEKRALRPSTIG